MKSILFKRLSLVFMLTIFFIAPYRAAFAQATSPLFPVALSVPIAPTPFQSDGKTHVVYELHLDNFRAGEVNLMKVEVWGEGKSDAPLASYQDAALDGLLARPGAVQPLKDKRVIGAGLHAIVFLWLTFDKAVDVPVSLRHRLTFRPGGSDAERIVEGAKIVVTQEKPLIIGSPVRGYGWVARFVSNTSFHRRGFITTNGNAVIAQRFAIDWGKFNDDGKVLRAGDGTKNSDFYIYGEEVIAVADSIVASIKDGIPENDPQSSTPAVPITLETVTGNHVVLDLGGNHYALYAHLQPGSIRVKQGERVRRGQVIAKVGNSGNAVGPHLHFQITNSPAMFEGEGVPYLIQSFDVWGRETPEEFQKGEWKSKANLKAVRHELELPSDSQVLSFP